MQGKYGFKYNVLKHYSTMCTYIFCICTSLSINFDILLFQIASNGKFIQPVVHFLTNLKTNNTNN